MNSFSKLAAFSVGLMLAASAIAQEPAPSPTPEPRAPQAQRATMSLTLREAVEMAVRRNLDVSIERFGPRLADAALRGERAVFEPSLGLAGKFTANSSPLNAARSAASLGLRSIRSEEIQTSYSLGGTIPTGLQYQFESSNTGAGNTFNQFDTEYSSFAGVTVTQPLLKGGWLDANLTGIRVARKSRQVAQENLALRLMTTVTTVQKAYYDLVFTIEDLKVRRESLALAEELLNENKIRLRAGVMSPLDVTEAEAAVAARKEEVLVGERSVHSQENVLKNLISDNVAELLGVTLVPVDAPSVAEVPSDVSESLRTAMRNRPDYVQARLEVERRDLLLRFARNQRLPRVDLQAGYGLNGLNGDYFPAYDEAFSFDNRQWSAGLVITVPLGNQRARADHQTAKLELERAHVSLKRVEQTIVVDVDNAVSQARTNFKRIETARAGRKLAEEKLAAEKKKLDAGTSTSFFVLQFQQDLAQARATELRAILDYNKSLADLYNAEATVLEHHNIEVKSE
jgi:outer membrane protein TolC